MAEAAAEARQPAVQACDLSFAFLPGGQEQLRGISLALPRGARCVVVGHNGAGKSTLLELLSGSKMAPAGTVKICGDDPFRTSAGRKVALVQGGWRAADGALNEERAAFRRVWELLGLAGPQLPEGPGGGGEQGEDAARKARLYEALGVCRLLERYVGSLSDGERRKAELARKLLEPKEVVLLDEATTDLDLLARRSLLGFLAAEHATVVSVTHVFDGLEGWTTHVLHLHEGSVLRLEEVPLQGPAPWRDAGGLFSLVADWLAAAAKDSLTSASLDVPMPGAGAAAGGDSESSALKVSGLSFAYAAWCPVALRVDQLQLPSGCRCVLVGPNGAGKSSLLSILAGRRMVKDGEVQVLGHRAFHDHPQLDPLVAILSSEWKRQVAEIGAGRALSFKDLAGTAMQDLVTQGLEMQALAGRMLRLIQMLGIDPTKPLGTLSDGMMRRVQIALKLLRPSKVLLVDEVTADLDVLARQALLRFLREESDAGCAVVYCTHILDGLDGWADHLLRLRPYGEQCELRQLRGGDGLFQTVLGFLEEDALLSALAPVASPAKAATGPSEELPVGWLQRGAAQAGSYGAYAWNEDRGSEDTWTFSSVAPAPPPMQAVIAQQQQQQQAIQQQQRQQQQQPLQAPSPFGGGPGPAAAGAFPGFAGFGGGAPPPALGASAAFAPDPILGGQPPGAASAAAPAPRREADPCPFGPGSRSNLMSVEELVKSGAIQPEGNLSGQR